jgi:hypothetical protein
MVVVRFFWKGNTRIRVKSQVITKGLIRLVKHKKENIMDLRIGDYHLISDTTQFILYHVTKLGEKSKTPGLPTENFVGYYPSIESAFKALPSKMLMRSNATTLLEVVDELAKYRTLITAALKGA